MKTFLIFLLFLFFLISCTSASRSERKKLPSPEVAHIYPSADTLPENLLRMYVSFSYPMKAVNNLKNIKLLNENGEEIKGAIFNNVYELWNAEQKTLTLILDPSRVKTGLVAHNTMGRALQSGKSFQLVIEKAEDVKGNNMEAPYIKTFIVGKEDKEIPNIQKWEIMTPNAHSFQPLQANFNQTLDYLSVFNSIRIVNEHNELVKGEATLTNQEKTLLFTPKEAWQKGVYTLQVNGRLEDPAGNNLNGLFEHKIGTLKNEQEGVVETLEFIIK